MNMMRNVAGPKLGTIAQAWQNDVPRLAAATRSECLELGDAAAVLWLVVRGHAHVVSKEGRFALEAGDWMALDRESDPWLQVGRSGLVLGIGLPANAIGTPTRGMHEPLLPLGKGHISHHQRWEALALWRRHGAFSGRGPGRDRYLREWAGVFAFLGAIQRDSRALAARCPGHSLRRKRQVLLRMQRAWLCLQGNPDRVTRIQELARASNFSLWYFTKVFSAVYGIGPQQFGVHMRLSQACELLRSTGLSINEVATACGFENACSFARAFRGHYGATASAYRQSAAAKTAPAFGVAA